MKLRESLKHFVSYFQSQMALLYNCNDNVIAVAFISGLQVSHSYKHLVKYEVTRKRDILSRAQKYIQIEDATRGETNHSLKRENEGEEQKPQFVPPKKNQNRDVRAVNKLARNPTIHGGSLEDGSAPDSHSDNLYQVLT